MLGQRQRNELGSLKSGNVLATALTELKDFPYSQQLGQFGRGSLLAEEDIQSDCYSCSLTCATDKGTLYVIRK